MTEKSAKWQIVFSKYQKKFKSKDVSQHEYEVLHVVAVANSQHLIVELSMILVNIARNAMQSPFEDDGSWLISSSAAPFHALCGTRCSPGTNQRYAPPPPCCRGRFRGLVATNMPLHHDLCSEGHAICHHVGGMVHLKASKCDNLR